MRIRGGPAAVIGEAAHVIRHCPPKAGGKAGEVGEFFWDGAANTLFWVDPKNRKLIEIAAHPVAKVVVPGKVPPDKDQPLSAGLVIQGKGGPPPVVEAGKQKNIRSKRERD